MRPSARGGGTEGSATQAVACSGTQSTAQGVLQPYATSLKGAYTSSLAPDTQLKALRAQVLSLLSLLSTKVQILTPVELRASHFCFYLSTGTCRFFFLARPSQADCCGHSLARARSSLAHPSPLRLQKRPLL